MDSSNRSWTPAAAGAAAVHADIGTRGRGRDSLFLMAVLTIDGGRGPRDVRVRNLSAGGVMVEVDRPVAPQTAVTLTVRGVGEITGTVAWCAEGRIGVAFDEQIDPKLARKPVGKGPGTPDYAKPLL